MKKYFAEEFNGHDGEFYLFDSVEEANDKAEEIWRYLTKKERKETRVFVGSLTEEDLNKYAFDDEGKVEDWGLYHSYSVEDDFFNSDNLQEE